MPRALLLIDVQNDYFNGTLPIGHPDPALSLANIGRAMDAARAAGVAVVAVRQLSPPGSPLLARGAPGSGLRPELLERGFDHQVDKTLPSAFVGTDLDAWLRGRGVDRLAVAGYMTHNCVDASVRDAAQRGYPVELLADASGSAACANRAGRADAGELHRLSLVVLQARFAAVLDTDAWIAALGSGALPGPEGVWRSSRQARGLAA